MLKSITRLQISNPDTFVCLKWADLATIINEYSQKLQLDSCAADLLAEALSAFYLFHSSEIKEITWTYSGKLKSIQITQNDFELSVQMTPKTFSPSLSKEELFGPEGKITIKVQKKEIIEQKSDSVFLLNPLQDFAFFVSKQLNIEASACSLPIKQKSSTNCFDAFFTLWLSIPSNKATDYFTQIRERLESPLFINALYDTSPQTLADIGFSTWQLIGENIQHPYLQCTQEKI